MMPSHNSAERVVRSRRHHVLVVRRRAELCSSGLTPALAFFFSTVVEEARAHTLPGRA